MGHVCPWWLIRTFDNPLRRIFHDPEAILRRHVAPGHSCLDLGCGYGYFSIPMARLCAPGGSVTAADVQPEMLEGVKRRAEKAGVASVIRLQRVEAGALRLRDPYDFALAFWVVHETADPEGTIREIHRVLKPGGRFLMAEPKVHVGKDDFRRFVACGEEAGFLTVDEPPVSLSRAVVMVRRGR